MLHWWCVALMLSYVVRLLRCVAKRVMSCILEVCLMVPGCCFVCKDVLLFLMLSCVAGTFNSVAWMIF